MVFAFRKRRAGHIRDYQERFENSYENYRWKQINNRPMVMDKRKEDFLILYKTSLKKACNFKDEPCKEKHVRRILCLAKTDNSGIFFFVPFDEIVTEQHPIRVFKCFFILHVLFRGCCFDKNLFAYSKLMLSKVQPQKILYAKYDNLCQLYIRLTKEKITFLAKMKFLKSNYTFLRETKSIPFMSMEAKLLLLTELGFQFTQHSQLLNEIVKNTQHAGMNPSTVETNQCQLRALIPILEDLDDIFKLIIITCERIYTDASFCDSTRDVFRTSFTPVFKLYKKILEKMAEYSFVTDRYRLPQLPDSYPFLVSPAQDMNKTPTPPLILTPSPEKLQEPKNENEPCVLFIPSPLETPPTEITTDMLMVDLRTRSLSPTLSYGGGDYQQIKELEHKLKEQEDLVAQNHEYMEQVSNLQERITSCTKANEILRKRLDSMMMTSQENEQFRKKYETISDMYSELRTKYKSVCETKSITSQQTTDALMENQKLREKIAELQTEISELVGINSLQSEKIADLQNQLKEAPSKSEKLLLGGLIKSLASCSLEAFENFIQNPPITDSISKTQFLEFLKNISQNISAIGYEVCEDNNEFDPMINFITRFQQIMMQLHDNTNKFLKVTYDEEIEKILEGMQEHYICSVKDISENPNSFKFSQFISQFQRLHEFLLMKVNEKPETFANLIDNYMEYDVEEELQNLTNLIDGAKSSLINADIHKDSIKENELQTIKGCGKIFDILKKLIQSAQKLEMDIKQSQEAKPADKNSYYAKNSAWAKGLYGFAQSIAPAVKVLVDSANGFVSGETIVEELTVSMNNVSSLVTQLFVSARSRADRGNPYLNEMGSTVASLRTEINEITNNAKMSSAQEEFTIPDLSKMGKSAIISREREMQIKITSLERELEKSREDLFKFRASLYEH